MDDANRQAALLDELADHLDPEVDYDAPELANTAAARELREIAAQLRRVYAGSDRTL